MSETYAMIDGKRYSLKFEGYDRGTYIHLPGCLAHQPGSCCQCGAAERAKRVYVALADAQEPFIHTQRLGPSVWQDQCTCGRSWPCALAEASPP